MTNWKEYKLGEIAKFSQGVQVPIEEQSDIPFDDSIRFIRIVDFTKNDSKDIRYIKNIGSKYIVEPDDLVMMRYGSQTAGKIARGYRGIIANNTFKISPKESILKKDFLFQYLSQNSVYEYFKSAQSSSTMPAITFGLIGNLKLRIPDLPTQTAIAEILSSLDDKIELNNKINQELENLAQTLFKQWFIDFEFPNENGDPYKSSGGEMVDSELGEIPKGWNIGAFGDLCKVVNGYAFKSKDFEETGSIGILKIRNVNGNVVDIINTQFVASDVVSSVQDKFRVLTGHILIAMTGAEVGKTGIVPETNKSLWLNQRVGRFEPIIENTIVFIYHLFNVLNFTQAVRNSAMGSAQPNISASGIESINCIIPPKEIILMFSAINQDSFDLTLKNLGENQELTNLRDTLLPKLISGELEVAEVMAEKA